MAFFAKVAGTGTLSDRLSALTLMVQSSPVHNTKALETLKGMAERGRGKGGREEALKAIRCVVDWWCGGGVPDRKLRYFRDQPLGHPERTDEHLVVWFFEDWLKKYFFGILQTLETLSLDTLPYVRTQALTLIATLLRDKPEQEHNLLRLLVNKLGDPEKSICSRASYHILQVLQKHPGMKAIVVREIHSIIFTVPSSSSTHTPSSSTLNGSTGPSANKHIRFGDDKKKDEKKEEKKTLRNGHVQYHSVITLNQIVLSPADQAAAAQLIGIYFDIFREVLGTSPSSSSSPSAPSHSKDSKDKAAPTDAPDSDEDVKLDAKGRILEKRRKPTTKGGKPKDGEVKGAAGFVEIEDANSRLISAILTGVNRAVPFAKLGSDEGSGIYTHIDTLFSITHKSTFNTSLQAMVLIQQIAASLSASSPSSSSTPSRPTKPLPKSKSKDKDAKRRTSSKATGTRPAEKVVDRYFRTFYASLHDPRLFHEREAGDVFELVVQGTAKSDPSPASTRAKALVRRFVQVLATVGCGGGGGSDLFATVPGLRSMVHASPSSSKGTTEETNRAYDPLSRNPVFSHPASSSLWELVPLTHHHHPAVALHARQLLRGEVVTANADLGQGTVMGFLDKFVFKNPKKLKSASDGSGIAPCSLPASALEGVKLVKGEVGRIGVEAVNERKWGDVKEEKVGVDELFFYKYFTAKQEREAAKQAKVDRRKAKGEESESSDEDGEGGSVPADSEEEEEEGPKTKKNGVEKAVEDAESDDEDASELDEDEIWTAMKASMPRAEGDDDLLLSDSDLSDEDDDSDLGEEFEKAMMSSDTNDDDALSLVEGSDNEDLLALDDIPTGLIPYDGPGSAASASDGEEEEWGGIEGEGDKKKRKRKGGKEESSRERKKRLKRLPTFASYEDYQKLIEEGPEDDI
ncbi:hypothetical protein FA13DRAFT_1728125 [Coprinellus micaceus]|uniref:CCAAT-binding factor domain-containing protein n=1 Tax=Coprinellus micaceus TaxID=71717 RepID=A0A4Y7TP33_COPMI|nr:hypothetical protein FA13DRAFT_1728125 [Coprinellus micaceus]